MEKELLEFIRENKLNPFNKEKTKLKNNQENIFKTTYAKSIFSKTIEKISRNFLFKDTENLWQLFNFTRDKLEIKKRQEYFKNLKSGDSSFLGDLEIPKPYWKPKYEVVAVTENENNFLKLRELGCPVKFLSSSDDVSELESCDVIQVLDCENFQNYLENLPQTIFLNDLDEVYLERYVEIFSGWKKNLEILSKQENKIKEMALKLLPLLKIIENNEKEKLDREKLDLKVDEMNILISEKIKELSISGKELVEMLSKKKFPEELEKIIFNEIKNSGISEDLLISGIPVAVDEEEFEKFIKIQNSQEYTSVAEEIKRKSKELKEIPEKLEMLSDFLLLIDFESGISNYIKDSKTFPEISEEFFIEDSKNLFLENPQPISFRLDNNFKCSILTGANSGGKTTLLEHIIQLISLMQVGLPISGKFFSPLFTEIYYFAKNKGSISKGAFETLLSQMSKIKSGEKTLVLADEMEAVTEPGVAGKIVNATAEFFIKRNCFLVIATHLGQEIKKNLPEKARIDGIEAKGLDENFELIVNHNPILGKIASSTPELIIEKLANAQGGDYFVWLNNYLKKI